MSYSHKFRRFIVFQEGAVQILFDLILDSSMTQIHAQALRALATVCCITESIEALEKVGGVESLSEILSGQSASEVVRAEAAGVVAQILSPSLDQYVHVSALLENMHDLVRSLTGALQEDIVVPQDSDSELHLLFQACVRAHPRTKCFFSRAQPSQT